MRSNIVIPSAGELVKSCRLARWHVEDLTLVKRGELILTIETDKVAQDMEAEYSGYLRIDLEAGEMVEIGGVVGSIEHDGSEGELEVGVRGDDTCGSGDVEMLGEVGGGDFGLVDCVLSFLKYLLMILGVLYVVEFVLYKL